MSFITAIRMGPGGTEQHITLCLTLEPSLGKTYNLTLASVAKPIAENGHVYKVGSPSGPVDVAAVIVGGKPHHVRTVANGKTTDNLINLPRF